jgi:BirA family biotin operon repressor/biotin-[acetyl-CoA-carboxylase] ligase
VEAAQVSFVAALAVADLARAYVPPSIVTLKWPNDVLVGGGKASGILVESGPAAGGLWLAVGIGVNLASHPAGTERPATHLGAHLRAEAAAPPSFDEALSRLAGAFGRWRSLWEREGFGPIRDAWSEAATGLGRLATARLGQETVEGIAEALEPDGALRLRLPGGGVRRITAGERCSKVLRLSHRRGRAAARRVGDCEGLHPTHVRTTGAVQALTSAVTLPPSAAPDCPTIAAPPVSPPRRCG